MIIKTIKRRYCAWSDWLSWNSFRLFIVKVEQFFVVIVVVLSYQQSKNQILKMSYQRCSMWKGVLRNFTTLTGKRLCQNLFFNKVAGFRPATLLKKRLWHRCFSVNFVRFLRALFLQNTFGRLLLDSEYI